MQFSSLLVVLVGLLAINSADAWWGRPFGFGGWGLGGGFGRWGLGWGGYGYGLGYPYGVGFGYPYAGYVYGKREVAEPMTRIECVYMTGQNKISCNR
jgi:hypothetical protein